MKYIANIITTGKIDISVFFNVTEDIENVDTSIPTLIVGWKEVKQLFPDQNILNPNITDTISWTFSKRERRYQYEIDIENFVKKVMNLVNQKVNYRFFNYLLASEVKRENFIKYVQAGYCSLYYNSRFLYLYNDKDCMTIGISLVDLAYIGIDVNNFISILNSNNNNIVYTKLKSGDYESYSLVKDNIKIIAYLNYLRNMDIYKEKENNG